MRSAVVAVAAVVVLAVALAPDVGAAREDRREAAVGAVAAAEGTGRAIAGEPEDRVPAPPPGAREEAAAAECGARCLAYTAVVAEAAMAGWSALAANHPGETGVASMIVSPFGCASGVRGTAGAPYVCGAMFAGLLGIGLWAATDYSSGSLSTEDRFWRGMIAWNAVAAAATTAYLLRDRDPAGARRAPAGPRPRVAIAPVRGGAGLWVQGEL